MKRGVFVWGVAALGAAPVGIEAQTMTFADAVARLFTAPAPQSAWFSAPFLAQVPLEKIGAITAGVTGALGPYQSIARNGTRYTVTFARGTIQAEGVLDASGAFAGLLITRMQSAACADRIAALFHTDPIPASWFGADMLAAVPIETIRAVLGSLVTRYGAFTGVAPATDGSYDLTFAGGTASMLIFLGADGKIVGLIAQPH